VRERIKKKDVSKKKKKTKGGRPGTNRWGNDIEEEKANKAVYDKSEERRGRKGGREKKNEKKRNDIDMGEEKRGARKGLSKKIRSRGVTKNGRVWGTRNGAKTSHVPGGGKSRNMGQQGKQKGRKWYLSNARNGIT